VSASNRVVITSLHIVVALADEGRAFQAHAATARKARSPNVEWHFDGTIGVDIEGDRRQRRPCTSFAMRTPNSDYHFKAKIVRIIHEILRIRYKRCHCIVQCGIFVSIVPL